MRGLNSAEQKGPESKEKLLDRHRRYLTYHTPGEVEMLRIAADGVVAGSVGYWEREEAGEQSYEIGWEVLAAFHGRGIGSTAAAALLERLRPIAKHRYIYAYPTPENAGSNGICRKLGFTLLGTGEFEYPLGTFSPHNIWRLDLRASPRPAA